MTPMIPITRPAFGPEELRAIQVPIENGWIVQGPFVKEFENKFSAFVGSKFSVATSSCTTALHIAVAALGLKPGDEVIVPAFTWVATPNVVEYMGATPVFCDIDLATFNIDVSLLEGLITQQTVGIIPVHLFGLSAEMGPLMRLAEKHSLWVVEDAACGLGAWHRGQHVGTIGDAGCFSFHPRKSITTGEGGMVTTQRAEIDDITRSLRDHGASQSDLARHTSRGGYLLPDYDRLGYNFRMTDIQGALGSVQMDRAEWILSERSRCASLYDALLADVQWLRIPATPDGYVHGYQGYVCLFQPEEATFAASKRLNERRNRVMSAVEAKGIATRQGTHAPVTQGYYVNKYGLRPDEFPQACVAERLSLTLPLYAGMESADQETVVAELMRAFEESF